MRTRSCSSPSTGSEAHTMSHKYPNTPDSPCEHAHRIIAQFTGGDQAVVLFPSFLQPATAQSAYRWDRHVPCQKKRQATLPFVSLAACSGPNAQGNQGCTYSPFPYDLGAIKTVWAILDNVWTLVLFLQLRSCQDKGMRLSLCYR